MKKIVLAFILCLQSMALQAASVHDRTSLDVGDAQIFLEVSGPDRSAPLLLFLHGGPGSVAHLVMFQATSGRLLEQSFLVAYLHQRGTGRSSQVPKAQQTIANNVSDVNHVVRYLMQTYGHKQVNIVGHSWGGMLAASYVTVHPEHTRRLALIATAMNFKQLLRHTYEGDLQWAKQTGNHEALAQLTTLTQAFDTPDHFGVVLSWADRAGGVASNFDMDAFLRAKQVDMDFPNWKSQQQQANAALIPEMLKLDLTRSMKHLRIPVLFMSGGLDTIVREVTMRKDFENYEGPKSFVRLDRSHHLPFIDESVELADELRAFFSP